MNEWQMFLLNKILEQKVILLFSTNISHKEMIEGIQD